MRGTRDTVLSVSELSRLAKTVAEAKDANAVFSAVADAASYNFV